MGESRGLTPSLPVVTTVSTRFRLSAELSRNASLLPMTTEEVSARG